MEEKLRAFLQKYIGQGELKKDKVQEDDVEMLIHEFCDKLQIPFEKISSEDFSAFLRILSLSKMLKNPNNMRGKAKPQPYYAPKRKKRR